MSSSDAAAIPRYAHGLFEAARRANEISKVGDDLRELAQVLAPSGLKNYLEDPKHGPDVKKQAIEKLAKMFRSRLTVNFLSVLLERSRVGILYGVSTHYTALEHEAGGVLPVEVILRAAPSEELRRKVEASLERLTKRKVNTTFKADPDMLGGVYIRIKNNVIDASVRTRIEELRRALLETNIN